MTGPLSLPPSCSVWIDGIRMADGQPGESDTTPVALTDLKVTWGRSNTLDQPGPASCAFQVLDMAGGQRFLDVLRIGARVDIQASATIYPDPTISTVTDPGFETGAPTTLRANATATWTTEKAHAGTHSVRLEPVDAGRSAWAVFPPAPFSPDVSAWNAVPRTVAGQTWEYGASVWLGQYLSPAQSVRVRPVTFTKPDGSDARALGDFVTGVTNGWQVLAGSTVPPPGVWLGVQVVLYPTGPAWQQVPVGVTWASLGDVPRWLDLAAVWVDDLVVLAPASGAARSGLVFSGRITDLVAEYDLGIGGTVVKVTAQDDTAELANRYVGSVPWLKESLSSRFSAIVAGSGQAVAYSVDPSVAGIQVSWRDVDNQPAAKLLQELAQSVAGVLWSATSLVSGPFLRLEDIDARPALFVLEMGTDNLVHVVVAPVVGDSGITLNACDLLLDPVSWEQDSQDASTRVAVTWREQTLDDKGQPAPTDRTETAVDAALETATGQRRVGVTTQLCVQADAQQVASSLLGRLSVGGWRVAGLTWRLEAEDKLDAASLSTVMTVLDGVTRLGLPIMLADLPGWVPLTDQADLPLFLEGGTFSNVDGAWVLDLLTSSAAAQGVPAVAWQDLPADWSWNEFGPEVSWSDLTGTGAGV